MPKKIKKCINEKILKFMRSCKNVCCSCIIFMYYGFNA